MKDLKIKEFREKFGLSQESLAMELGVTRNTIINWENGSKIPGPTLKRVVAFVEKKQSEVNPISFNLENTEEEYAAAPLSNSTMKSDKQIISELLDQISLDRDLISDLLKEKKTLRKQLEECETHNANLKNK